MLSAAHTSKYGQSVAPWNSQSHLKTPCHLFYVGRVEESSIRSPGLWKVTLWHSGTSLWVTHPLLDSFKPLRLPRIERTPVIAHAFTCSLSVSWCSQHFGESCLRNWLSISTQANTNFQTTASQTPREEKHNPENNTHFQIKTIRKRELMQQTRICSPSKELSLSVFSTVSCAWALSNGRY